MPDAFWRDAPIRPIDSLAELERTLRQQLADLEREYRERADPVIRELVRIESMRPMPRFLVAATLIPPENVDRLLAAVQGALEPPGEAGGG